MIVPREQLEKVVFVLLVKMEKNLVMTKQNALIVPGEHLDGMVNVLIVHLQHIVAYPVLYIVFNVRMDKQQIIMVQNVLIVPREHMEIMVILVMEINILIVPVLQLVKFVRMEK